VLAIAGFLVGFLMDIVGSVAGVKYIRDLAYAVALISAILGNWLAMLAILPFVFVKCKGCGARAMYSRFPFLVPLMDRRCCTCRETASLAKKSA